MSHYLIYFSGVETSFRIPELESICHVLNLHLTYDASHLDHSRYLKVQTDEPHKLSSLAKRSVLIHQITLLWGEGPMMESLRLSVRQYLAETKFDIPEESWKFNFLISNKRGMDMKTKIDFAEDLGVSFDGPVELRSPDHTLDLYLDYGTAKKSPDMPLYYYFGLMVAEGGRGLVPKFDTKHRTFIGNTAMCPQMAFLMANQGKVSDGMLVLDPFVGSGGIALACAEFGGYCLGSDINLTLLSGRGLSSRGHGFRLASENMWTCFEKFGLRSHLVDNVACDQHRPVWRSSMKVDAIITDPPYGVRESPRKAVTAKSAERYAITQLVEDLLNFAERHLRAGGRLVYFLPVLTSTYQEDDIPRHPKFDFISASLDPIVGGFSRVLVTMEKKSVSEDAVDDVTWREQCQSLQGNVRRECFKEREIRNKQRQQDKEQAAAQEQVAAEGIAQAAAQDREPTAAQDQGPG